MADPYADIEEDENRGDSQYPKANANIPEFLKDLTGSFRKTQHERSYQEDSQAVVNAYITPESIEPIRKAFADAIKPLFERFIRDAIPVREQAARRFYCTTATVNTDGQRIATEDHTAKERLIFNNGDETAYIAASFEELDSAFSRFPIPAGSTLTKKTTAAIFARSAQNTTEIAIDTETDR